MGKQPDFWMCWALVSELAFAVCSQTRFGKSGAISRSRKIKAERYTNKNGSLGGILWLRVGWGGLGA